MLTEAQKFLGSEKVIGNEFQKVVVNVKGKDIVFTVRPLTSDEYDASINKSIKIGVDKKDISVNNSAGNEYICLQCIVEPNFRQQEWIEYVNAEIKEHNIKEQKRVEEKYQKELKEYENAVEKGEKRQMPIKEKVILTKEVQIANELLKRVLGAGIIAELADKIVKLSGFGTQIKDYIDEVKN